MSLQQEGILDIGISHDGNCPSWAPEKIEDDLNKKCGGKTIPVCVKRGKGTRGIKNIRTIKNENSNCQPGEEKSWNLKAGTGSRTANLFFCKSFGEAPFLQDVDIVEGQNRPPGWEREDQDLQEGCRNDVYMYLAKKQISKRDLCGTGENAWQSACDDVCEKNSPCWNAKKAECTNPNNLGNTKCQDWCKNNPFECDSAAITFCQNNITNNDFCSCFDDNAFAGLSTEMKQDQQFARTAAVCWSKKCPQSYKTKQIQDYDKCPKCIQIQNFSNLESGKDLNIDTEQICQVSTSGGSPVPAPSIGATPTSNLQAQGQININKESEKRQRNLYIGLIIAFLFFISFSSIIMLFLVSNE